MRSLRPYQKQAVQECWKALKEDDRAVLLMASVGAGKSLMLANILLTMQHAGKKSLCLVNNAELVRNNHATFCQEGGNASIYCAALGSKDLSSSVVFGTPQSILNGINKNEPISQIRFNLIIVDEAHAINYLNDHSCFMRILRHYKQSYPDMRLLGATGTNFRFKGTEIVGPSCLFKSQVGNITTEQLIQDEYLIKPSFHIDPELALDFSKVKVKSNGLFDHKELESVVEKSTRLTELICKQLVHIMRTQKRHGVFIFATTKKHAYEILSHLPMEESAIILGDTPQHERTKILDKGRSGVIKYLVNIAIVSVGVDVPPYDTLAYLRLTESLVLLVQTMGRVLRLSPQTQKTNALVLDFAGNIERHRDWDNPLLLEALKQTIDKDKPLVIICPECQELNTEHARRCVGTPKETRCNYYFEFKNCPNEKCQVKNDISSRHCRLCQTEIIDPNEKLSLEIIKSPTKEVEVLESKYIVSGPKQGFKLSCIYSCQDNNGRKSMVSEFYFSSSQKALNVFYGQFVRKHCTESSKWYHCLHIRAKVEEMINEINSPKRLVLIEKEGQLKIKKKIFEDYLK